MVREARRRHGSRAEDRRGRARAYVFAATAFETARGEGFEEEGIHARNPFFGAYATGERTARAAAPVKTFPRRAGCSSPSVPASRTSCGWGASRDAKRLGPTRVADFIPRHPRKRRHRRAGSAARRAPGMEGKRQETRSRLCRGRGERRRGRRDATNAGDAKKPKGAWLGYAFVAFRDAEEAAQAMLHVDGKVVRETTSDGDPVTITLSARPATIKGHRRRSRREATRRRTAAKKRRETTPTTTPSPTTTTTPERRSRWRPARTRPASRSRARVAAVRAARRAETLGYHTVEAYLAAEKAASDAKTNKSLSPPPKAQKPLPSPTYTRVRGAPIPPRLLENLRFALEKHAMARGVA